MDLNTLINLSTVVRAAQSNARVARLTDDGDVVYGTARRIAGDTSDIETCGLDVTLDAGLETTWPVSELALEVGYGEFVVNP